MPLALLLIVIGIVLVVLVHGILGAIGVACILVGLVLLIWPYIAGRGKRTV